MNRPETNHFTGMWFTMSLVVWVLIGGITFPQTQIGDASDTPPTAQEEPPAFEEQGEVIERGIMRRDHLGQPGLLPPKTTAPSSPPPRVFTPSVGALFTDNTFRYDAPTPSLTAVANAIQLKHKSLTSLLKVSPNLPMTVPVAISVGYFSSTASQRRTQNYKAETGNLILYFDTEGDGKPRAMRFDISLRELIPGGRSFSLSRTITLEPLYDVTISPLRFSVRNNCDTVGKSDIRFRWRSPDGKQHSIKFKVNRGDTKHITEFAWSAREVSTSRNFFEPMFIFNELDFGGEYEPPTASHGPALIPGTTQNIDILLDEHSYSDQPTTHVNPGKCQAEIKYNITRTLLKFKLA